MSSVGSIGMVVIGTAMNATKDISRKHDPIPTLLAGSMLAFGVSMISGFVDPGLGTAFAALFLVGSFLFSGVVLFDITTKLLSSRKA